MYKRQNPDSLVSVAGREIVATRAFVISGADAADAPSPDDVACASRRSEEQHLRGGVVSRNSARPLALDLLSAACTGPQQPRRGLTARTAIDARTLGADATGVARRLRLAAPVRVASEAVKGWGSSSAGWQRGARLPSAVTKAV